MGLVLPWFVEVLPDAEEGAWARGCAGGCVCAAWPRAYAGGCSGGVGRLLMAERREGK